MSREHESAAGAVAEVSAVSRQSEFMRHARRWPLWAAPTKILIGSAEACDWVLPGPNVLPRECLLRWDGQLLIASSFGERGGREFILEPNAPLQVGALELLLTPLGTVARPPAPESTQIPPPPALDLHAEKTQLPRRPALDLHAEKTQLPRRPALDLHAEKTQLPRRPALDLHAEKTQLPRRPALDLDEEPTSVALPAPGRAARGKRPARRVVTAALNATSGEFSAAGPTLMQVPAGEPTVLIDPTLATTGQPRRRRRRPVLLGLVGGVLALALIAVASDEHPPAARGQGAALTVPPREAQVAPATAPPSPSPSLRAVAKAPVRAAAPARAAAPPPLPTIATPARKAPSPTPPAGNTTTRLASIAPLPSVATAPSVPTLRTSAEPAPAAIAPAAIAPAPVPQAAIAPAAIAPAPAPQATPPAAPAASAPDRAAFDRIGAECRPLPPDSHATPEEHALLQLAIEAYQTGRRSEAQRLFHALVCRPEVGPPARFMARLLFASTPQLLPRDRGVRTRRLLDETERELAEHPELWAQSESIAGGTLVNPKLSAFDFKDQPKCNIFIGEMLYRAGFIPPGAPAPGQPSVNYPSVNQMVARAERLAKSEPWDMSDGLQWFDVVPKNAAEPGDLVLIAARDRGDRDAFHTEHGHVEIIRDISYEAGSIKSVSTVGARSHGVKLSPGAGRVFGEKLAGAYQFSQFAMLVRPRMR